MACNADSVLAALRELVIARGGCVDGKLFSRPAATAPVGEVMAVAIQYGATPAELFR